MSAHTASDLLASLDALGYVHRSDLIDAGWTPDAIRRSVRELGMTVYRRQWIVRPNAQKEIHRSAAAGGRLTCVSAAETLKLWRPPEAKGMHVALAPHSSSCFTGDADVRVHRAVGPVPAPPRKLVDQIDNILAVTATCVPFEDALAVWESAVNKKLVTVDHLVKVTGWGPSARRLCTTVSAKSDSGIETRFAVRMRRIGVAVVQQAKIHGHRVDGLIGDRLVVQIDGYAFHSSAAVRREDIAHDRALRLLGYTVLRFDYQQIMYDWDAVEQQVLAAIAQGLHLAH